MLTKEIDMASRKVALMFWALGLSISFLLWPAVSGAQPIKIGAMFIMTGPMGGYGKHADQAIQMAVDEINANGGILGRKLEAIVEDTKLNKDVAITLADRFIAKEKVDFLMGPTSSGIATALSGIAKDNKKILILTQAAADEFTGVHFHPYVFSVLSNAMMHSRSGARFMAAKPYKRYMCIGPDYSYGHSSWNMFKTELMALRPDVDIVGELFPKFLSTDYMEYINKINEAEPDAVWSPLWGNDAVIFIRQAMNTGMLRKSNLPFL